MRAWLFPEPALLGLLVDRPRHGYELYKQVRGQWGRVWRIEISQMYAILGVYAARGWIATRTKPQETRPAKKMLQLTAAGRRAFEEWMRQPARGLREFRVDFFLRLYFAQSAGVAAARQLLAQQIASINKELKAYSRQAASNEPDDFDQLVVDFRIQQSRAILRWLENHREELLRPDADSKSMPRIFKGKTNYKEI